MIRPLLRPAGAAVLLAALLAGCDGSNNFRNPTGPTGTSDTDVTAPAVKVQFPTAGATVQVGDSLFTQVRASDDRGVASIVLESYAVRGSVPLGTDQKVTRYNTKTVVLARNGVRDTTVSRYLLAAGDTLPDARVVVKATAVDSAGNKTADSVVFAIQGRNVQKPVVTIQLPVDSARVAVGDSVFTQFRVTDGAGIASVTIDAFALRGDPALGTQTRVERFSSKTVSLTGLGHTVRDTVLTRYLLAVADSSPEHAVRLVVTATNVNGQISADTAAINIGGPRVTITAPVQGAVVSGGTSLAVRVSAADRFDLISSVRVRASGAFTADTTVTLAIPRATVDTTILLPVPAGANGAALIDAYTTSGARIVGQARPVGVTVNPSAQDVTPPRVTFSVIASPRSEATDTFTVTVQASDETQVDSVGATVRMSFRNAAGHDTTVVVSQRLASSATTFRFPLAVLGGAGLDTSTVRLDVTAFGKDHAGNCGAAVSPNTAQSLPCTTGAGGAVSAGGPGAQVVFLLVRGQTVLTTPGDVIADLAADGTRVFASNLSRNRVEVLPFRATTFATPISVGSQPWGLALGRTSDTLLVANSGGTNISVVALGPATPVEARRIRTPDVNLYDVSYDVQSDTATSSVPVDYSDRPQFVGQVSTGQILFSTKPTPTRADGTVRIYDATKDTTFEFNRGQEVFDGYADPLQGRAIAVNALSAAKVSGGTLLLCPRRRLATQADPACINDKPSNVSSTLTALRAAGLTDTRLDLGLALPSLGLSDTTFIAISTDRSTIAFGEGVRDPGRILRFQVTPGGLQGTTRETRDLVGNAAERVIGLGLNADGSLGVARGAQVYFFDNFLRLQGVVASGSPSGGSTLHPQNANYPAPDGLRVGFVSGIENGAPYVDVIDTYSFRSIHRIFVRDAVTGTLIAKQVAPGDPDAGTVVLRLFAITTRGVVRINLQAADLQ